MTFLQPLLLAGLPLIALPILIHLINKWRHRTLQWGAMMFLLEAKRMTRGMAKLRFWLIMLTRMLAIAALIFAVSRPLTSGWLGTAIGGKADTTIIILDRSASMEQQELQTRKSKRSAALNQLSSLLKSQGSTSRLVLIDSVGNTPQQVDSAEHLLVLPDTASTAATGNLPAMLQTALQYVQANQSGRTDIWICSDLRENDWNSDDGRWSAIRNEFQRLEAVRFYLLAYSQTAADNIAVRVTNVRQRKVEKKRELLLDVTFRRESTITTPVTFPAEFNINGARSVVNIELVGAEFVLEGHSIPLDEATSTGWGRVEIPADENLQDNASYFVFSEPPVHHTTIVSNDAHIARTLRLAAAAPLDPSVTYSATNLSLDLATQIDWGTSSLILWHGEVPDGTFAEQLTRFVRSGRPVMFFPPEEVSDKAIFGLHWGIWQGDDTKDPVQVATWRGDSDLLAHAKSGEPLPLGKLRVVRQRAIEGDGGTPLARLEGGQPLITRAQTDGGPVYFCGTLPALSHSSFAQDGVAFYAMIQRALEIGAATQSNAQQIDAGTPQAKDVANWQPVADASRELLLSTRWLNAGAYQQGDRWMAINRPSSEDMAIVLSDAQLAELMSGLDYRRVERTIGEEGPLASEIWRAILLVMGLALVAEACLCLPDRRPVTMN